MRVRMQLLKNPTGGWGIYKEILHDNGKWETALIKL